MRRTWQHYAAPAAFLLAATIAVVLVRAGFEKGHKAGASSLARGTTSAVVAVSGPAPTARPGRRGVRTKFWIVKAGDTFAVISTATGVSVARIQKLNPRLSSTSLFIGERVRIR